MPSGVFTLKQVEQAIGQGAWTNQPPISVNYLVVAGGGGGGRNWGGGGGAGGLLQGSIGITAGTSYTVTVGAGGSGGSNDITNNATSGSNSVFGSITATGGGFGGMYNFQNAASGGSGGGGGSGANAGNLGQGTANQGNAGGAGDNGGANSCAGGGGGAGTRGLAATTSTAGNGGAGVASDISGSRVTYAGGGGGTSNSGGTAGIGGVGGGGNGGKYGTSAPTSAGGNTGGGGGGAQYLEYSGGNGGSGIVIVSYPGTTQWFTGGVVNYYNGNVIHIFYQSGTLAPTTPTPILPTYQISRSLRFNSADSAYLNRTPASAGNQKTWTWSGWVKLGLLSVNQYGMFSSRDGTTGNRLTIGLQSDNTLIVYGNNGSVDTINVYTQQVFRDPSAWYHIVIALDTTQATASNRCKVYVNGSQVTSFSTATYPTQNADLAINQASEHNIGKYALTGNFVDGYMTEINFINGQALTPSSFGETNAQTGVWQPKAYSGTYGTNGFYLNFSDNSNTTAATLGKDYSGNGNNWTPNNFSVTAGAGNDSLVDSPTAYGTADTGVGGEVRGNYCTWNPLASNSSAIITNGNLDVATTISDVGQARGTIGVSSGKWYWEVTRTTSGANLIAGIVNAATGADKYPGQTSGSYGYYGLDGTKVNNGSFSAYGASFGIGDVIGVALDLDVGTLVFYKNGTSQGTAFTGLSGTFFPAASDDTGGGSMNYVGNFGQRPFAYTAPAGYRALTTWNLPTPTIGATTATQAGNYFNPVLWTGTNANPRTVTGVGFQPDLVWVKKRSAVGTNFLQDAVRGVTSTDSRSLASNNTDAETNFYTVNGGVTAFTSDGFTTSGGSTNLNLNESGVTYVAWNWKANGTGSTNTAGSITSTVSANTTSGFSIVTYTGNGTDNATIGHGLGASPQLIIVKSRSNVTGWPVWHGTFAANDYMTLDTTAAKASASSLFGGSNASLPTSTVFKVGTNGSVNASSYTYVAYCFAAVAGYSAFGSYTGNGSTDGPFVFTGFRPAFVLIKSSSATSDWWLYDTKRGTFNVLNAPLYPNGNFAESPTSALDLDILSNGFKSRSNNGTVNGNGTTYIYAAFAESPFKYALAR